MKRYITMSAIVFFASCGSYTGTVLGDPITVVPTTLGDDSIVNAIKQYSNLTEADVNQYKLLWLGSIGTFGAFVVGAASTIAGGMGVGAIQGTAPESIPTWLTNSLVVTGLGSVSAGYLSYKMLYPRMRSGMLNKVQKFMDICEGLKPFQGSRFSIAHAWWYTKGEIMQNLPTGWLAKGDVAVYNALANLVYQGECASALLGNIYQYGQDPLIQEKMDMINNVYLIDLKNNKSIYEKDLQFVLGQKKQAELADIQMKREEERAVAELADLKAGAGLKEAGVGLVKAKTIQTYGEMIADGIRNIRDSLNYVYKNKEKIAYRAGILSAAAYGGYVYLKNKLGYAE